MEIRQFTYINMVAECGSITKAAARLFITQPALSNYINKLEEELGVKLFDRSVNPVKLTYAGEKYLGYARSILLLMGDLDREMRDISNNQVGRIRAGFPTERMLYMLPLILPIFSARYPGIRLETVNLSGDKLVESLTQGESDIVFLPSWSPYKGVVQHKLADEELVLVAARGYLKDEDLISREKKIFNWDRITRLPLITQKEGHALRASVDTLLKGTGKKASIAMETHSNMLSCRLAAQGLGVAVVPEISVHMLSNEDNLECYHLSEYPITWEVCALYREEQYLGKPETALLDIAGQVLRSHKKKLWDSF